MFNSVETYQLINLVSKIIPYLQNCTIINDILAGNHEIRLTRKFEIRGILRPFSVPINRVSRGPPVLSKITLFDDLCLTNHLLVSCFHNRTDELDMCVTRAYSAAIILSNSFVKIGIPKV